MITLRDVMTEDVITVTPETSLREVASLLASEHISGVPVVKSDGSVAGVVSATDLMEFDAESVPTPVGSGPGSDVRSPGRTEGWPDEDGAPGAYFTEGWDGPVDVTERFQAAEEAAWSELEQHGVAEVMTRSLVAVAPDTDVREAARVMTEADVRRVLVLEDDRLVGVVTSRDLVRAVAEHGLQG